MITKCETLLRASIKDLQVAKQIYEARPSGSGRLKLEFVPAMITAADHFESLMLLVNQDGKRPSHFLFFHFALFVANI